MNFTSSLIASIVRSFSRRYFFLTRAALLSASLSLGCYSLPAAAQDRLFPDDAERGILFFPIGYDRARIDDKIYPFAVAVQFRDQENILVFPEDYSRYIGTAVVVYTLDIDGELSRVWFLTESEGANFRPFKPQRPPTTSEDEADVLKKPGDALDALNDDGKVPDAKPGGRPPPSGGGQSHGASGGASRE